MEQVIRFARTSATRTVGQQKQTLGQRLSVQRVHCYCSDLDLLLQRVGCRSETAFYTNHPPNTFYTNPTTVYATPRLTPTTIYAPARFTPTTVYAKPRLTPTTIYAPARFTPTTVDAKPRFTRTAVDTKPRFMPTTVYTATCFTPNTRRNWILFGTGLLVCESIGDADRESTNCRTTAQICNHGPIRAAHPLLLLGSGFAAAVRRM